jgi:DNA-binding IclR family transcriptional regulator
MDTSQSLDRGLKVLDAIDVASAPLGVREIARQLDLNPTIVQRSLNTLAAHGLVEQVAETRRYRIGYRAIRLGASAQSDDKLTHIAQPRLSELAENPGLNGYLGVLVEDRAVYILAVPSRHRVVVRVAPGETMPLHATALGKVLLAAAGDVRARQILMKERLARMTPHTVVDPRKLLALLPEIRERGYASVHEENFLGIVSVGAPVRNAEGKVIAAISFAYTIGTQPASAFEDVVHTTVATAAAISREMGCPEDAMAGFGARPPGSPEVRPRRRIGSSRGTK